VTRQQRRLRSGFADFGPENSQARSASAMRAAWQRALAAEQQAAFGYPVLGPHLSGAEQQLAVACSNAHETLRDATADALAGARLTPAAPRADYPGMYPVSSAGAARALAIRLEDDCAAAWRYLYLRAASTTGTLAGQLRSSAQDALTASAVRAAQWRAASGTIRPTLPFPGA
jgi:hypothetical protein